MSDSTVVHILTFTSRSLLVDKVKISPDQDIWVGECLEDPELTLVVIAGSPNGLDSESSFDLAPRRQQRAEVASAALLECLNAPVTEIASTVLKAECDHVHAASLIDAAMQSVLDADDCIAAVWKTNATEAVFFVGWRFLEAHEKYHQKIFANPPDCIQQLPNVIDTNVVLHVTFKSIQNMKNEL